MMLSDRTIRALVDAGDIVIAPTPGDKQMQPVSVDLRLGNSFTRLPVHRDSGHTSVLTNYQVMRPGEFLLAATHERIRLAPHIAGEVKGKSTLARKGLLVECAGLVDPGFDGTITLELKNLSHLPIPLHAGMPIAQIAFYALDTAVIRPYGSTGLGSHYQGQTRATPAAE